MNIKEIFSRKLIELREAKKLTKKELAEKLEISAASLGYYESGERLPDISIACKIADFFGITCDELIRGVKSENVNVNKELGLTDKAIDMLKILKITNMDDILNVINFLIEKLHFETKNEDISIENDNDSLLFSIYLYLTIQNENNFDFTLTYNGNISINGEILGNESKKHHYLDLLPTTVSIDKNTIIDNVLFTRVQEALKYSKENYFKEYLKEVSYNADNNPQEE